MWRARVVCLGAAFFVTACARVPSPSLPPRPQVDKIAGQQIPADLREVSFSSLEGWQADRHGEALKAFQKSCLKILPLPDQRALAEGAGAPGGRIKNWRGLCQAALNLKPADDAQARRFFETWFVPYAVRTGEGLNSEGLFTGYYEPELKGSWKQGGAFQIPLLARPVDLVSVSLGKFDPQLGGNTVWGRVVNGRVAPYLDRASIESGALGDLARPLLWVDNAVDAFFLHVQGSGRVRMLDGSIVRVGFAGKNGKTYRSIGRILIDSGEIPADHLTMDAIRAWVAARPVKGAALLIQNPSYVFFRVLQGDGPVGAEGVVLTAERSLAVDRRFMPLGAPVWLETYDPLDSKKPYNRLLMAQDAGGAIKGAVRGDIFFGAGERATKRAGNMKRPGRYFILLPHSVMPPRS